ncbi:hypothetical protein EDEG_04217 [Edhazardia aedis USNM 41457]|uniref:Exonuclease 1 n=1 Tax=Edhazardia aedis (strain USNM 41457) TaxID=1003232 RepID=J9DPQ0_EDHAE|nr:hypothetical protein EDEG_04217 [Edhazardia aedis USNM 41457]|eukprot:EJW04530.1 hypothetical protein EDEG_04217 [Edhazardia aedis USNM 41457]
MGITGLHPIIKPILSRKSIISYKNRTIGVDGHSWLYQIAHIVAEELFYKIPTTKHAKPFLEKIKKLQRNAIRLVFVFDGDILVSKEKTNNERKIRKEKIKEVVHDYLKAGNLSRAKMLMKQCVSINSDFLNVIIDLLRRENIEFIISPYESDAQLCYLQKIGYIDYILTEDSDLVVYGADKILYKFDGSYVLEYQKSMLNKAKDDFFAENI